MSSYSELATSIINKNGQGGKFSGLNTALDLRQAFKDAATQFAYSQQLAKEQGYNTGVAGIINSSQMWGGDPTQLAANINTYRNVVNAGVNGTPNISASSLATGNSTDNSMQIQGNNPSGFDKSVSNDPNNPDGIVLNASSKKLDLTINPEDNTKTWDGSPVLGGFKGASLQTRAFNQFANNVNSYMKTKSNQVGALNAKVDQAILTQKLVDQYYDPNTGQYNVPPNKYYELSVGVAKLLNPQGILTNEQINGINQATAQGDLGKSLTWATGKLHNGSSQDVIKDTVSTIQREGVAAENLREKDLENLKKQVPPKLSVAAAKQILNSVAPSSYKEYLKTQAKGVEYGGAQGNQEAQINQSTNRVGKYSFS